MDFIHPLDDFWFDGDPPDRIVNLCRRAWGALRGPCRAQDPTSSAQDCPGDTTDKGGAPGALPSAVASLGAWEVAQLDRWYLLGRTS